MVDVELTGLLQEITQPSEHRKISVLDYDYLDIFHFSQNGFSFIRFPVRQPTQLGTT